MKTIYTILVLIAGILAPTQAGINAQLSQGLRSNLLAALVSFIVGTLGLIIYILILRTPWPSLGGMAKIPFWLWLGGLCGAFLVTVTIAAVPKLGATTMFAFFLAGQMIASLVFDHFGLLGYPVHPLNIWRVLGTILLFAGVLIIKWF